MNLHNLTIQKVHQGFAHKEFSCEELTRTHIARIQERQPRINAFITLSEELALAQAQEVDARLRAGKPLRALEGVPCAIKDAILVKGVRATAGSKILEQYTASYDATVVTRLKEAGAVILGKTNMDEFAMGSSGETSAYGVTRNPHDETRVPGGSSAGSAACVADDQAVFALGSDTGGSIRQPASFCGITGFKPTYGAVSRSGLIAMASSLDQIGPFAKTVEDAQVVFNVIAGKDPLDSTTIDLKAAHSEQKIKNLRVGVPKEYFIDGMDKEVETVVRRAIAFLEAEGAKVEEVSLPLSPYALAVYYILMPGEVSANLARFDGIRYGTPAAANDLLDLYCATRGTQFGAEARRRIMLGTYVLSAGYRDAYYKQAQKVRVLIAQEFETMFQKVDVLITPTSPTPAFRFGEKAADPLTMYLSDIFTVSANVGGIPGLSLPCGTSQGLPVGLQLLGARGDDARLLSLGTMVQNMLH